MRYQALASVTTGKRGNIRSDPEVVDPFARFEQSDQPPWPFAAPRPRFGRIIWISVLGDNDRVRPTLAIQNIELCRPLLRVWWIELLKALLQHNFF